MVLLQPPGQAGTPGQEIGQTSPLALLVVLILLLAVALLVRSMNKHLRKIPPSFDEPTDRSRGETDADR